MQRWLVVSTSVVALATACAAPGPKHAPSRDPASVATPQPVLTAPSPRVAGNSAGSSIGPVPSSLPPGGLSVDVDPANVRVVLGAPPDPRSNAIVYLALPSEPGGSGGKGTPPAHETAHVQIYDQSGLFHVDPARFTFVDSTGKTHAPLISSTISAGALGAVDLHKDQGVAGDITFDALPGPGHIEFIDANGTTVCSWTVAS